MCKHLCFFVWLYKQPNLLATKERLDLRLTPAEQYMIGTDTSTAWDIYCFRRCQRQWWIHEPRWLCVTWRTETSSGSIGQLSWDDRYFALFSHTTHEQSWQGKTNIMINLLFVVLITNCNCRCTIHVTNAKILFWVLFTFKNLWSIHASPLCLSVFVVIKIADLHKGFRRPVAMW